MVRLVRGTSSQTLGATIASQVFLAISGIVAARALGVDGRGTLALLWLVPAVLTLLGGIGIAPATTFFVAREPSHVRSILKSAVSILVFPAVILSVAYGTVILTVDIAGHEYSTAEALMSALLVPILLAQNLGIAALLGQQRFRAYNVTRIGPPFLYMVLASAILVSGEASLTALLAVMTGSWLLAAVATWFILLHDLPVSDGEPEAGRRDILEFGLRGVIGSVSPIDDVRLDQFMVGLMLDARALGLYVAAIAFCNLPRFVAVSIGAVAYPRVASRRGREAWAVGTRYLRIGLVLIGGAVLGMFVALPILLPLFFGEEFSDAVPIGRILLVAAVFLATNRLMSEIARGLGHPGFGSIAELANGLVFILGVLLVAGPSLSTSGIAWSVVAGAVSSSLVLAALLLRSWKRRDEPGPEEAAPGTGP